MALSFIERIRLSVAKAIAPKGGSSGRGWPALVPGMDVGRAASWTDDPAEQVKHLKHWVYAAVRAIANRVAATELCIYQKQRNGDDPVEIEDPNHPAVSLFAKVNPFHTRYWLWSQTLTFLELTGNAYWYVPVNGRQAPAEIWCMQPQRVKVIPDATNFIRGYEYNAGSGKKITFAREEIIHLKLPNPQDLYYGRGPLGAAAETVDAHEAMKTTQYRMMQRGAFPGGAITSEEELDDKQQERLREQFQSKYTGADNSGRWVVLEGGIKAEPLTLTPQEMAFLESQKSNRDEILAIFGVPAAILGLSETVNKAVAEAMDYIFARYTVAPLTQLIEDQLNQDLMPRFGEDLFVSFTDPVGVDQKAERDAARLDFQAGVLETNEYREVIGWEPLPGGNERYVSMSLIPVGKDAPEEPEPEPISEPKPTEENPEETPPEDMMPPEKGLHRDRERGFAWQKAAYMRVAPKRERLAASAAGRVFRAQKRRVLAALVRELAKHKAAGVLTKDGADRLTESIFDRRKESREWANNMLPQLRGTLHDGGEAAMQGVGFGGRFDLNHPKAEKWLRGKGAAYWDSDDAPNHTTIGRIHNTLADAMNSGMTPREMVDVVAMVFDDSLARARTIARTEVVGAYNGGGDVARDELAAEGIATQKKWYTTMDDRTREDHADANGQVAEHGEAFEVGGYQLDYPGDPSAPPEEIINCRCGCATIVKD